jgi:hypothetical protein
VVEDFRDLLAALVAANVRFLVVGAHALGVHGVPRATVDLDIWVETSPDNAQRIWAALAAFGAPLDELSVSITDFTREDLVVQFGVPPYRIDILTGLSGVTFDEAWAQRIESPLEGVRVPFIGRDDLIRNKRAAGRLKDLSDVESLGQSER